ncbi:MAG: Rpn family recombination-promoting nuclease/putative transposase [Planctomycetaceae bacterium]|jgi:hypothetical protein|nr:Rpn family recombination-promoting nuclease/putative transposase [Planctomycetaceae bacterium]
MAKKTGKKVPIYVDTVIIKKSTPETETSESHLWDIAQDRFCRKILDDQIIASDILRYYADAELGKYVDLDNLKSEKTNFFGATLGNPFKEFRVDIPYTTPLLDDTNGYMVLIVFEHKSDLGDFVFIQIYAYMHLINYDKWQRAGYPQSIKSSFRPYIPIGVIVYCGDEKEESKIVSYQDMYKNAIPEFLRDFVSQSKLIRVNLNKFPYDNLPGRPETQAFVETMKRMHDGTLQDNLCSMLAHFNETTIGPRINDIIYSICTYASSKLTIGADEFEKIIRVSITGKKGNDMAENLKKSIADEILNQAMLIAEPKIKEEGRIEGIVEGEAKGKAEAILNILQKRFGRVRKGVVERVRAKRDPSVLDTLMLQTLDCTSINEFADLL